MATTTIIPDDDEVVTTTTTTSTIIKKVTEVLNLTLNSTMMTTEASMTTTAAADADDELDYYYYDYSQLDEHEAKADAEFEAEWAKISSGGLGDIVKPVINVGEYPIDKSDLFVTNPKAWDPLQNFLDLVVAKIYLVLPAFVIGILLGLLTWIIYLLCNKMFSRTKKMSHLPTNGQECHQIRELVNQIPPEPQIEEQQPSKVLMAGKQTLVRNPIDPASKFAAAVGNNNAGAVSTSSGISSSSSTPISFETGSEAGRMGGGHSNAGSSTGSRTGVPPVLQAVEDLANTVESAIRASRSSEATAMNNGACRMDSFPDETR